MPGGPVVLTGATGFIGRRLQAQLIAEGIPVTAVVRPDSKHAGRLLPDVQAEYCPLSDAERLTEIVRGAAAVIYCAGAVRGGSLEHFRPANITGVARIVEALNRAGRTTPLLLISSLAATRPEISDYANSKRLGELELEAARSFSWTVFRPPAVYGPGDREMRPLLQLARKGLLIRPGPSHQRVSLIYVDDLSEAVLSWLENPAAGHAQTFELHDGASGGYGWTDIAHAAGSRRPLFLGVPRSLMNVLAKLNLWLSGLFSYRPMLTPGKVRELTQDAWICDNTALTNASGWTPSTTLEQGIRLTFARNNQA